jgi:hypothetical protein
MRPDEGTSTRVGLLGRELGVKTSEASSVLGRGVEPIVFVLLLEALLLVFALCRPLAKQADADVARLET